MWNGWMDSLMESWFEYVEWRGMTPTGNIQTSFHVKKAITSLALYKQNVIVGTISGMIHCWNYKTDTCKVLFGFCFFRKVGVELSPFHHSLFVCSQGPPSLFLKWLFYSFLWLEEQQRDSSSPFVVHLYQYGVWSSQEHTPYSPCCMTIFLFD